MEIQVCPHCRTRVLPSADGTCPSCRRSVNQTPLSEWAGQFGDSAAPETDPVNPYASPKHVDTESTRYHTTRQDRGLLWILFSFEGRIPRRVYWGAYFADVAFFYVGVLLVMSVLGEESDAGMIGILTLYLPVAWVLLAVTVKRWHDRDKSGFWIFIGLIPIIGPIWAFIETGCLRGTYGDNGYGPDPT